MPKYDFNKVALQLYSNHTSAWLFSCKFAAHIFRTSFPRNTSRWLLLYFNERSLKSCRGEVVCVPQKKKYTNKYRWNLFRFYEYGWSYLTY